MTKNGAIPLPNFAMPPLMNNHGNYIVSLGNVCRWLGAKAEALGVEIYPGFAATEVLYDESGAVIGVATGDMGMEKDGTPGPAFQRGMALLGKYVLIGEGVRGSLAKQIIARFDLAAQSEPQKFGIGIKELWEVAPRKTQARPGAAFLWLAARRQHRRRLVPLPPREQSRRGRLRLASQLQEPLHLALP